MSELKGSEYTSSPEKLQFDNQLKRLLQPLALRIETIVIDALAPDLEPDGDSYYYDKRLRQDGTVFELPKIRTMLEQTPDMPDDAELDFSKNNPRIPSKRARFIRNSGLDELPQLSLIPELSFVGPRSMSEDHFDNLIYQAEKVDKAVASDYEHLYTDPSIRHGLSGPAQLSLIWFDERNSAEVVVAALKKDIAYYWRNATAASDRSIVFRTPVWLAISSLYKHLPMLHSKAPTANPSE
jgi:lipopolysaccharide/colanic/teichoic acid biosynthesis glycosyltransferase